MTDAYKAPDADLHITDETASSFNNTSGMGKGHPLPPGVAGWSWGALFWNWIWAIGNKTWIGVLAFVPYIGFIVAIVLGIKGREWAWQNKRWDSVEHFQRVQRSWSVWAGIVMIVCLLLGFGLAFYRG
jgi:hypothetical protein